MELNQLKKQKSRIWFLHIYVGGDTTMEVG